MKTQTIHKAKELDPVQRNMVHEQLVKREMRFENKHVSNQFQVNPFTMQALPEKPNTVNPYKKRQEVLDTMRGTGSPRLLQTEIDKTIIAKSLEPKKKYNTPMTSSHDIGWFAEEMERIKPMTNHALKENEITKYAREFYEHKGFSPFQKK